MRLNWIMPWLCLLLAASLLAGSAAYALAQPAPASWGLAQLMQSLAQVHSAAASFAERKTMQMLNAPLIASGTLTYIAPDYVRKTTLLPVPETFTLDHGQVTITGGQDHQTQNFSLTDYPQIGGLIEGIRATLAGDLPALSRFYTVQLTGTAPDWQLFLQPKDAGLARFLKWMLIRGSQNQINTIDSASSNGDHSEMGITETMSDAK